MFNAGMMGHMNQQQQMALLQQMAQLQMAQLGNMKPAQPSSQPLSMVIPGAGQFVLVPQTQLHQMQQFQDAQLRQQMSANQMQHQMSDQMSDMGSMDIRSMERELQKQQISAAKFQQQQKQPEMPPRMQNNMQNNIQRPKQHIKSQTKIHVSASGKPMSQKVQPRALPKRVLVTKLPPHIKTVETLADVFYPYGIISEIQIFKDRSQLTPGLADIIAKVDPRQNATPAATVEFETSQAAKFAVSIMRKREKQLQFRVALLKGDSVDEKHCHNYQKPARRVSSVGSNKAESGAETDTLSSSGYDTCSLKSESPRPHESMVKPPSESSSDCYNDHCIMEDFENLSVSTHSGEHMIDQNAPRNLGPIAPPKTKKVKNSAKTGKLSQFRANYRGQQAM